uniref:Cytochrome b n=1 Tax=Dolicheulota formosensis TaxID=1632114 RepID=A0A0H3W559_DOLFO|nr:cytochrome b [Dolicheulota formosensis]AKJ85740.1 cytochrome b [Dolicheulota formosensis]
MYLMKKIREMESLLSLPSPVNISIWWNFGSMLGLMLGLQILTGIILSLHYTADMWNTFNSIVHIMRDVPGGWFFRMLHANGASMFFLLMYFHMGRGIYYQSYLTQHRTWLIGVSIFLLSMATAFLGYVLPWGQMSYWGATVITNLFSAVPYFGETLVSWIWGGFSVNQATLNRFYSFHFLLPFLVGIMSLLHLVFLHDKGSTNPLGNLSHVSKVPFHPYFSWKDLVGFSIMIFLVMYVVFFYPNFFTDPENFMEANSMVTPVHIQPEWYFLFAYAILRSVPSKLGGVMALAASVLYLYAFPLLAYYLPKSATSFSIISQLFFWVYVVAFILLTWLGACPVEQPFVMLSQVLTFVYFLTPLFYMLSSAVWSKFY